MLLIVIGSMIGMLTLSIKITVSLQKSIFLIAISFCLLLGVILFFFRQSTQYKRNRLKFNNFIFAISMIGETKSAFFILGIIISFAFHLILLIRYIKII